MLRVVAYATVGFLLLPMVIVVIASFTTTGYVVFPPKGFTLEWYRVASQKDEYIASFEISATVAALTAAIASVIGGLAALGLARYRFRGSSFLDALFMSPLVLPTIAIGIGITQFLTMLDVTRSILTLVFGHVIITVPYVIRLVTASVVGLDRAPEMAAANLGASAVQVFRYVTLPLIIPGVIAGAAFAFVVSFDNVTISVFLSTPRIVPLPIRIFSAMGFPIRPDLIAIASFLIIVTAAVIIVLERTLSVRRLFLAR